MDTYSIIRFFNNGRERKVIDTGLSLEEAKEHCRRDDTEGEDFFDGFLQE